MISLHFSCFIVNFFYIVKHFMILLGCWRFVIISWYEWRTPLFLTLITSAGWQVNCSRTKNGAWIQKIIVSKLCLIYLLPSESVILKHKKWFRIWKRDGETTFFFFATRTKQNSRNSKIANPRFIMPARLDLSVWLVAFLLRVAFFFCEFSICF